MYTIMKDMVTNPHTAIVECLEAAKEYIPEAHQNKFEVALKVLK